MEIINQISNSLQKGNETELKQFVWQALHIGVSANEILENGLLSGMERVCDQFQKNEILLPTVLASQFVLESGIAVLKEQYPVPVGKICIGTVFGDFHDMGKNIVKLILEAKGFMVWDLGANISAEVFVEKAIEYRCDIICCSISISSATNEIGKILAILNEKGMRDTISLLAGGNAVNEEICQRQCVTYCGNNALSTADTALAMLMDNYASFNGK